MDEKRVRKAIAFFGRKIYELGELEEQTDGVLVHNIEYYLTAIEALEKQLPMKPEEVVGAIYSKSYECKNCGSELEPHDVFGEYCKWCGQRLDWSE